MKSFNVEIQGIADLLQHRFPGEELQPSERGSIPGAVGSARGKLEEWKQCLYLLSDGTIYQPEQHIHGAMIKATTVKIPGRRGKTYKDFIIANIFIDPAFIPHGVTIDSFNEARKTTGPVPDNFLDTVYIDRRPVRIQKARIMRLRPAIVKGWKLAFEIQCADDEVRSDVIKLILDEAGRTIGIGDFRPRFGRFIVTKFGEM
jgi:hypothetical protein